MPDEPASTAVPLYERPEVHDRRWFLLAVLCLSLVMVVMATAGLNTALPSIQEDLGASATVLQWIIDAYALVFAGLLLMAGALGDRFGRKGALLAGLAVFGVGSLVSGLAHSTSQVIAGRAVSGVGAALLMPATLSLITAIFPPEERTRAIAVWVGFAGAGGALGPVVSGALLDHFWWGSAMLANLPVVAIAGVAIAIFSPRSRDDTVTPLDPRGALLSLVGIAALLFGIIEGPERGWTDVVVLVTFVVAVVFIIGFVVWERRAPHPMLPISYFADRRFSVGSGVVMTTFALIFAFFFSFTLYLQFARGYSPLDAGLAGLPSAVALVLVSSRSAGIAERLGSGRAMALGFVLIGIGMMVFALIGVDTPFLVLMIGLVSFSSGCAVAMAPGTSNIMSAVPTAHAGVGSAVNDTTRELGGALGIAIFGSIVNSAYRSGIDLGNLGLPAAQLHSAEQSIGAATGIGAQLGGEQGGAVLERAANAFTDAFNTGMLVAAVLAFATAAIVWRTLSASREAAAAAASVAVDVEVELPLKAVRFDDYGDIEVLAVRDVPRPDPGPDQVLVAVRAAGINIGEAKIRSGLVREIFPATFPSGQGSDLAGVVEQIGAGVQGVAVGDEVIGFTDDRASHAEYVLVEAANLTAKPSEVPWEVAGALFVAGVTGVATVRAVAPTAGEAVVIAGAGGGVGGFAVQLAVHTGARVIALASERHHPWLRERGAFPVMYGDGLRERVTAAARTPVAAFIDLVGSGYVELALELGVARDRIDTIVDFPAIEKHGVKGAGGAAAASAATLAELAQAIAVGDLVVPIQRTYPLDDVRAAFTELEAGHIAGKIVLIP